MLLMVEAHPSGFAPKIEIRGYTQEQIGYHAVLLEEAGFAKVIKTTSFGSKSPEAMMTQLTWAGHEFLDSAREIKRWNQGNDLIVKVGGASIHKWVAILSQLIKRELGLDSQIV